MIIKEQGKVRIGSMLLNAEIEWEPVFNEEENGLHYANSWFEHLRDNKTITVEGSITPIIDEAHQLPERLN